jgi:hypothetical protein
MSDDPFGHNGSTTPKEYDENPYDEVNNLWNPKEERQSLLRKTMDSNAVQVVSQLNCFRNMYKPRYIRSINLTLLFLFYFLWDNCRAGLQRRCTIGTDIIKPLQTFFW